MTQREAFRGRRRNRQQAELMPTTPPRPCRHPACPTLVTGGNGYTTNTEAKRLAQAVQWIPFPHFAAKQEIAEVLANEVSLIRETDGALEPCDLIFVVWKQSPLSFGGASMIEIGRAVCDVVFTLGTETVAAFTE